MSDPIVKVKHPDESKTFAFSFVGQIPSGDVLSSSPTVTAIPSVETDTSLTIGSPAITTQSITDDDGNTIAPGLAIIVTISGGTDENDYYMECKAVSSSGETVVLLQGEPPILPVLKVRSGVP